jgi:phage terminase large subunit
VQAVDIDTGKLWPVAPWFKITEREIVCAHTDSLAIFRGLQNHTAASIKSLEGFNRAWYEEAQTLTQRSLDLALPTFRAPGSQQRFSWNPDLDTDPVDVNCSAKISTRPKTRISSASRSTIPTTRGFPTNCAGTWNATSAATTKSICTFGAAAIARIPRRRFSRTGRSSRSTPPPPGTILLGADWGFSVDPTVGIICFIVGRTLYIWREVWAIGCEIDRTPALFDKLDPDGRPSAPRIRTGNRSRAVSRSWPTARDPKPSYMQRHGFRACTADQGAGFGRGRRRIPEVNTTS